MIDIKMDLYDIIKRYEEVIQIYVSDPKLEIFENQVKMSEFCHQFTPKLVREWENFTNQEKKMIQEKDEELRQAGKRYH